LGSIWKPRWNPPAQTKTWEDSDLVDQRIGAGTHRRAFIAVALALFAGAIPTLGADPPALVIRDGTLFDSISGTMQPGRTVVMEGDTIKAMGTPEKPVAVPAGARVIDAQSKFVVPGLIDAHVHLVHRLNFARVTGTDAAEPYCPPGLALHQELELLLASGLTPAAALQAATIAPTRALKQVQHLDSIEPGKQADLVILTSDPTADIRNTRKIELIVRGGQVCRPLRITFPARPGDRGSFGIAARRASGAVLGGRG
jgi:imidazolonepropionase-like amidohydrolase